MLNLAYEYKLKPTTEQAQEIERILGVCRKVWNFALRERKDWINSRKCRVDACSIVSEYIIPTDAPYPNYTLQCKSLTIAKVQYPELKTVNAQVLQQVLRRFRDCVCGYATQGNGISSVQKSVQNAFSCISTNAKELRARHLNQVASIGCGGVHQVEGHS